MQSRAPVEDQTEDSLPEEEKVLVNFNHSKGTSHRRMSAADIQASEDDIWSSTTCQERLVR